MTPAQLKAIQALLSSPTKAEAAKAAGITERTLRRYLEDDTFRREYQKACIERIEDAARQAQRTISQAVETLQEIMLDTEHPASARISAARSLLEYSARMTEQLDVLGRLEALEEAERERKEQD